MSELDVFTAYTALVASLAGLAWHVRNWWYDAPDLRLIGGRVMEYVGEPYVVAPHGPVLQKPSRLIFEVTLANHGHQEIYVQGIGVEMATGESFELGIGAPLAPRPDNVPCFLKAGASTKIEVLAGVAFGADMLAGERPEVSGVYAIDGRQRRWWLPAEDFKRLRAETRARDENMKAATRARVAKEREASGLAEIAAENEAEDGAEKEWSNKTESK